MCSFLKNATFCVLLRSFAKDVAFFVFFYVLCKRTLGSLRSLRSLQKKIEFFAFFYVLKKSTQKNASFFWVSYIAKNSKKERKRTLRALKERKRTLRALKERKRTMHSERRRTWCPTLPFFNTINSQSQRIMGPL